MKPSFLFSAVFDLYHLHLSSALVVSSKIHIQLNTYTVHTNKVPWFPPSVRTRKENKDRCC